MSQQQVQAYLHFSGDVCVHTQRAPLAYDAECTQTNGGIRFVHAAALTPGEIIEATLSTVQGHERLKLKVRWCRRKGEQHVVGACLLSDEDACRARMLTQISHIDAYRQRERHGGRDLDADAAAIEWIERHAHQIPAII